MPGIAARKTWFKGRSLSTSTSREVDLRSVDWGKVGPWSPLGLALLVVVLGVTAGVTLAFGSAGARDKLAISLILIGMGEIALYQGVGILWFGPRVAARKEALVTATPTSNAADVASGKATGLVELKGKAAAPGRDAANGGTMTSPVAGVPCVYFRVEVVRVEEDRTNTGDGMQRTINRRTVLDQEWGDPFWLEDASGRARVDPTGAEVRGRVVAQRQEGPQRDDQLRDAMQGEFRARGFDITLPWKSGWSGPTLGYETTEQAIQPGDALYVLGAVAQRDGTPVVASASASDRCLIAVGTEEEVITQARADARTAILGGALFAGIGLVVAIVGIVLLVVA